MPLSDKYKLDRARYHRAQDEKADALVSALCDTYTTITGRPASDRLRDELYQAVRFEL